MHFELLRFSVDFMKPFLEDFEGFYYGGMKLCVVGHFLVGSPLLNLLIYFYGFCFLSVYSACFGLSFHLLSSMLFSFPWLLPPLVSFVQLGFFGLYFSVLVGLLFLVL